MPMSIKKVVNKLAVPMMTLCAVASVGTSFTAWAQDNQSKDAPATSDPSQAVVPDAPVTDDVLSDLMKDTPAEAKAQPVADSPVATTDPVDPAVAAAAAPSPAGASQADKPEKSARGIEEIVVTATKREESLAQDQLIAHYEGRMAKWWTPDDVVFVNELPHTATGKVHKLKLRQQFSDYRLPGVAA